MVPPEAYTLSSFAPLHTARLAPKLRSPSSQDISGTVFLVLNLRRSLLWPQGGAQAPFQDCLQGWERLAQSRSLTGLAFLCLFNQPPTREKSALVHCWKAEKSPHPSSFRQHHSLSFLRFFPLSLARAVWTLDIGYILFLTLLFQLTFCPRRLPLSYILSVFNPILASLWL